HDFQHLANERELRRQVLGRRAARRLVLRVDLHPLRFRFLVEGHGEVGGISLADALEEHGGEAVDGVGGHALAGREMRERVVGAEDGVRAIHQPERRHRGVLTWCRRTAWVVWTARSAWFSAARGTWGRGSSAAFSR